MHKTDTEHRGEPPVERQFNPVLLVLAVVITLGLLLIVGLAVVAYFAAPTVLNALERLSTDNVAGNPANVASDATSNSDVSWRALAVDKINPYLAKANQRPLSYRWQEGQEYAYQFSVEVKESTRPWTMSGNLEFKVGLVEVADTETRSTGTAFAIDARGYMATCAHVVKQATRLSVSIKGHRHPARLVAVDDLADVAIIQVQNAELTPLPLAPADDVELAQKVLILGFPMTEVLGKGIKVSTGIISGFEESAWGRQLSIDAVVNPGNSGGPVLDDWGQVVGVASATLRGERLGSVGFASPATALRKLMSSVEVQPTQIEATILDSRLQPNEVAKRTEPSVGLVEVEGSIDDRLTKIDATINYTDSRFATTVRIVNGQRQTGNRMAGTMRVSSLGNFPNGSELQRIPYILKSIPELIVEPLDIVNATQWTVHRERTLQFSDESEANRSPLARMMGPMGRALLAPTQPNEVVSIPAEEIIRFTLRAQDGNVLSFEKIYQFRSLDDSDKPALKVSGKGTWSFDVERGVPMSLDEELVCELQDANGIVKVPLTIHVKQRNWQEVVEERRLAQEQHAERQRQLEFEKTSPNPILVAETLEQLTGKDPGQYWRALDRLAQMAIVEQLRDEVLEKVRPLMTSKLIGVDDRAQAAFIHWADQSCVEELRKLARKSIRGGGSLQSLAIAGLAKYRQPEDIPTFIALLNDSFLQRACVAALTEYGSDAEPAVLASLTNQSDVFIVMRHLEVLAEIGTQVSADELSSNTTLQAIQNRVHCQRALDAINKRLEEK